MDDLPCVNLRSLFFAEEDEMAVFTAKMLCNSCPVTANCLELAIQLRAEDGIWGGTTPDERRKMVARRASLARRETKRLRMLKMKDTKTLGA